jgi:hypothetical protein
LEIAGGRGRCRGKKTWRECVAEDMKVLGLEERDVRDRLKWSKGIMVDRLIRAGVDTADVKSFMNIYYRCRKKTRATIECF